MTTPNKDREEFEAWYENPYFGEARFMKDAGDYIYQVVRESWLAWQAACANKNAEIAELEGILRIFKTGQYEFEHGDDKSADRTYGRAIEKTDSYFKAKESL